MQFRPAAAQDLVPLTGGERGSIAILINAGDLDLAEDMLADRMRAQGETAENLLLRGVLNYHRERYDSALADLRRSFSLDEHDPTTSKALGLCLVKLGRNDLAETFFEIAARLAPDDYSGHYYLGLNRYVTKRFESAATSFGRALDLRPHSVDAHCYLGRSREALGDTETAGRLYRAAVDLNREGAEKSSEPPLLLGTMLFRQQRLDEAKTLLWEALQYDPDSPLAYYWLGLAFEQTADLTAAVRALQNAAVLMQTDHRPHYALARIYRRTGRLAESSEALRRFRELRKRSESETY
ncbi:MAG: tetratricopeptide repeat protein [Bryobacterales bacterium]|nr:tetratricopeptide repeat protein [Bryobacterales bacterium]